MNAWSYLPLPIFPEGGLASSVITTVWVGAHVLVFFNLRFGWVLSGVVAPGYLVPLLIVKPWAAGVIFIEASATYAGVWLFSEYLSRLGLWSNLFGRDRFFALVLWSVVIRLIFDAWLMPAIGETVTTIWQINFDYRSNLQSFGLVIIALLANQFWKTGFFRGLPQALTTCGATYVIVRYGLMEVTNFNISDLGYIYEDFAVSILGSPKAYMIIIATAFISSYFNLAYGWDFNGVLIPALIALQWSQPVKILSSFVEAFILLVMAHFILQLPAFRRVTIEGGRKLLLFFNINFVYKLLLGHLIAAWFPEVKVTDYYAFGYLLPTLLAAKMHDKGIVIRLSRVTLQTSLIAALTASLAGFALTYISSLSPWPPSPPATAAPLPSRNLTGKSLTEVIWADKAYMYPHQDAQAVRPLPHEMDLFVAAVRSLQAYRQRPSERLLTQARTLLSQVNYRLDTIQNRYLYLYEAPPHKGWGMYVLDMQADPPGLLIETPRPLESQNLLEASASFFTASAARALAIAGPRTTLPGAQHIDQTIDILRTPQSFFHAFHREMARNNVLQIRGYSDGGMQRIKTRRRRARLAETSSQGQTPQTSSLWIKSALPPGLNLMHLQTLMDAPRLTWDEPPFANAQRDAMRTGFAELFLTLADSHHLLFRSQSTAPDQHHSFELPQLSTPLPAWLLQLQAQFASEGSGLYRPPSLDALLYFDNEILTPLLRLLQTPAAGGAWAAPRRDALRAIHAAARAYGYQLIYHESAKGDAQYLVLTEIANAPQDRRHWGSYVWRLGTPRHYVVQVPRPLLEAETLTYGATLFERLRAHALLISGAHANVNLDGRADPLNAQQPQSLFNLAHQVILREHQHTDMLVIQSRGFAYHPDRPRPQADMLLAFHSGANTLDTLPPLGRQFVRLLWRDGLNARFVDGTEETIGYGAASAAQSKYMDATSHKDFALLWLSPSVRARYRRQSENRSLAAQFHALQVATLSETLSDYMLKQTPWGDAAMLPEALTTQLRQYLADQDIVRLRHLTRAWPAYRFERLLDPNTDQAFLLVYAPTEALALVANLNSWELAKTFRTGRMGAAATIARFVDTRALWLELDGE